VVRVPSGSFSSVNELERSGILVSHGHRTSVTRFLGVAMSTSASYLSSSHVDPRAVGAPSADKTSWITAKHVTIRVSEPGSCRSSERNRAVARLALERVTARMPTSFAMAHIDIRVTRHAARRAYYSLAFSGAHAARLAYVWRCEADADTSIVQMTSVALHEAIHAVIALSERQASDTSDMEAVAYGGEACYYLALEAVNALSTTQHQALRTHLADSIYARPGVTPQALCSVYRAHMARPVSHPQRSRVAR